MLVPIEYPPGLFRMGTEYQNDTRFFDSNLWRWSKGKSSPIGGWEQLGSTTISGSPRDGHIWVDLSGVERLAIGSDEGLFVVSTAGVVTDITPSGWTSLSNTGDTLVTTGGDTLVTTGGDTLVTVATSSGNSWSIDSAGQQLFAVNDADGVVYTWLPGDTQATVLASAPTASALMVSEERILVLFGAGGDPRQIQWSDSEGFTTWTPSTTNFTRDFPLQTSGELMAGARIRGGALNWTTRDVHLQRFILRPNVYGFTQEGENCGLVSRGAYVVDDDVAYWMSRDKFCRWAGGVDEIPCSIHDDVFLPGTGLNMAQASKVRAIHVPKHSEIWWLYPKGEATEVNKAAVYNYLEQHWSHHDIVRLGGVPNDQGFDYPIMFGSDGVIWQHEKGSTRTGAGTIFARGGPKELGAGDVIMYGNYLISDEANQGDVQTYVRTRLDPNGSETVSGPFTSASQRAGCSFAGRQAAIEHRLVSGSGVVGTFRVDVQPGGEM